MTYSSIAVVASVVGLFFFIFFLVFENDLLETYTIKKHVKVVILAFDLFILVLPLKTVCVVKELEVKLHDVVLFLGDLQFQKMVSIHL